MSGSITRNHVTLLPYQREGVLHLAFGERALLADEMGLGKTIQAIAACILLAKRKQIGRVLVVCPASLKAEWEEQIARFCDRSTRLVFGSRAQRHAAYRDPAFFTIVNYEQVLGDAEEINGTLKPDVIVLDEAQRIKNWQTKTARRVKSLRSRYAFVLTGTPLENRIDELYSIAQYLDPEILGPLFRFNRDFYQLDERGRPVDYQNLADLRARLQPLLLRRRKSDVEAQLPGRTVKTYFVPMAEEQQSRYEDYHFPARQLIAKAQHRPLTQAEFEKLQMLLACMRMVCDTPAILDPTCRISPKLEELEGILGDLLDEPDRKVIVFSEWERMLTMVRELAGEMGVDAAWHTGSLPQPRRRAEINRFKHDPACRLFLSTDSGSVGLNLQVASAVINVDLPWNPAKLEQRIARAWRKNQVRSVSVVNLVTEDSIEHNILHLLGRKQALADGVIDGAGDLATLKMPSGRAAFVERMQAVMAASPRPMTRALPPEEILVAALLERHGDTLLLAEARHGVDGRPKVLIVLDLDAPIGRRDRTSGIRRLCRGRCGRPRHLARDATIRGLRLVAIHPRGAASPSLRNADRTTCRSARAGPKFWALDRGGSTRSAHGKGPRVRGLCGGSARASRQGPAEGRRGADGTTQGTSGRSIDRIRHGHQTACGTRRISGRRARHSGCQPAKRRVARPGNHQSARFDGRADFDGGRLPSSGPAQAAGGLVNLSGGRALLVLL